MGKENIILLWALSMCLVKSMILLDKTIPKSVIKRYNPITIMWARMVAIYLFSWSKQNQTSTMKQIQWKYA